VSFVGLKGLIDQQKTKDKKEGRQPIYRTATLLHYITQITLA